MIKYLLVFFISFSLSAAEVESAAKERMEEENLFRFQNFSLLSHRQNYLLPITYNFNPNNKPNEDLKARGIDTGIDRIMRIETKFQLSFKFPIAKDLFTQNDKVWAAYTQQSYWQVYNQNSSRPFRESNYEPEIFYINPIDMSMGDLKFSAFIFGFVHQSNGQSEKLSRSWNRAYLQFVFSLEHFVVSFKPWYRFSDGAKDDNPNIEHYVGYFDLRMAYRNADWVYSLLIRNNLKEDFKGFREFGVSFPLDERLKGFFQYTNGYGESLIDYNHSTNRIGLGLIVSDFI